MYDEILFPTDGSDASFDAFPHALSHATQYDARLHVLSVADTGKYSTVTFENDVEDVLEKEGWRVVEDVAETAESEGVEVVTDVVQGTPYREILAYVRDRDVDLVTMATRGESGVKRALLGSTTERVLRESDVPVLAVCGSD